jgi:hypothetical protein
MTGNDEKEVLIRRRSKKRPGKNEQHIPVQKI